MPGKIFCCAWSSGKHLLEKPASVASVSGRTLALDGFHCIVIPDDFAPTTSAITHGLILLSFNVSTENYARLHGAKFVFGAQLSEAKTALTICMYTQRRRRHISRRGTCPHF